MIGPTSGKIVFDGAATALFEFGFLSVSRAKLKKPMRFCCFDCCVSQKQVKQFLMSEK